MFIVAIVFISAFVVVVLLIMALSSSSPEQKQTLERLESLTSAARHEPES